MTSIDYALTVLLALMSLAMISFGIWTLYVVYDIIR